LRIASADARHFDLASELEFVDARAVRAENIAATSDADAQG
jgi:hypothetical protein